MVVTTPSTIMPSPTRNKPKSAFQGIFNRIVTLTLDLSTLKFDAFILVPKSLSGESLIKFHQQILKTSC